jgi:hypothetical protein
MKLCLESLAVFSSSSTAEGADGALTARRTDAPAGTTTFIASSVSSTYGGGGAASLPANVQRVAIRRRAQRVAPPREVKSATRLLSETPTTR